MLIPQRAIKLHACPRLFLVIQPVSKDLTHFPTLFSSGFLKQWIFLSQPLAEVYIPTSSFSKDTVNSSMRRSDPRHKTL